MYFNNISVYLMMLHYYKRNRINFWVALKMLSVEYRAYLSFIYCATQKNDESSQENCSQYYFKRTANCVRNNMLQCNFKNDEIEIFYRSLQQDVFSRIWRASHWLLDLQENLKDFRYQYPKYSLLRLKMCFQQSSFVMNFKCN